MKEVRVRFAPSPTGPLHIGGARSALFNYLLAKRLKGKFVLRIEDTDLERSSKESEENILESLKWLGIIWDEGPDKEGAYAPYRQTERLQTYQTYTEKLIEDGKAYYCFCSEEELEQERKKYLDRGETPVYSGKCLTLSEEEKNNYIKEGRKPVVRFRVPKDKEVVINDCVRGRVVFESNGLGDFVIVKSDGIPTYNYAVVIDDALMGINHVVRAEEHLSNTPRQVLIYEALGFELPEFAHISLILGKDRSKMSKRHGATSVVQYKEAGYLPEAVVNFLALLGWSPVGEEEIFTMEEIIEQFSLERVAKNPAVFDMDKLRWINGVYIRKSSLEKIIEMSIPFLQREGMISYQLTDEELAWVKLLVEGFKEHLSTVADIVQYASQMIEQCIQIEEDDAKELLREDTFPLVAKTFKKKLDALPELNPPAVKNMLKELTKELKLNGKKVYMPLRIALTGQMHGADLFYIISILGKDLTLKRLEHTAKGMHININ